MWRRERVVVELGSRRFHDRADAFERDRARDRAPAVAGWLTIRVTGRRLRDEPAAVAADLRALLAARR